MEDAAGMPWATNGGKILPAHNYNTVVTKNCQLITTNL